MEAIVEAQSTTSPDEGLSGWAGALGCPGQFPMFCDKRGLY